MVKKGDFELQVVCASTKEPFQEHIADNGAVYAEIEPQLEYYMKFLSERAGVVFRNITLDGENLGYMVPFVKDAHVGVPSYKGIWETKDGISTNTALKFQKLGGSSTSQTSTGSFWIGEVSIDVYEYIELEGKCHQTFTSEWQGKQDNEGGISGAMKKAVKSQQGSITKSKKDDGIRNNDKLGKKLAHISIKYCTALGLIHVGILPKPSTWDYLRKMKPHKPSTLPACLVNVKPQTIKMQVSAYNGALLKTEKIEFFDLSHLNDDDSDNE